MFCHPIKLAKIRKNAIFAFFQRWFDTFANDCNRPNYIAAKRTDEGLRVKQPPEATTIVDQRSMMRDYKVSIFIYCL